jgi:hypothetical protein
MLVIQPDVSLVALVLGFQGADYDSACGLIFFYGDSKLAPRVSLLSEKFVVERIGIFDELDDLGTQCATFRDFFRII